MSTKKRYISRAEHLARSNWQKLAAEDKRLPAWGKLPHHDRLHLIRQIRQDLNEYAQSQAVRMSQALSAEDALKLDARALMVLEGICKGEGTDESLEAIEFCVLSTLECGRQLATKEQREKVRAECGPAVDAMDSAHERHARTGRVGFSGKELVAVRQAMTWYSSFLESGATRQQICTAMETALEQQKARANSRRQAAERLVSA